MMSGATYWLPGPKIKDPAQGRVLILRLFSTYRTKLTVPL